MTDTDPKTFNGCDTVCINGGMSFEPGVSTSQKEA